MSVKREASFHEAGHAVAAYRSKFHYLAGDIRLQSYGAGYIDVGLSKTKLQTAGKAVSDDSTRDKEVATDLAIVLCAGFVAERLAAERDTNLTPNRSCAEPDHELMKQQLSLAGLSKKFDRHESSAQQLLTADWNLVSSLADLLYERVTVDATDVQDFLEKNA